MTVTTNHDVAPRPPSPWTGSRHQTLHRWQLDVTASLAGATQTLQVLAAELVAAHQAGWRLVEPMWGGHLVAARASRRRRGQAALGGLPAPNTGTALPARGWRLRVVDEPAAPGLETYDPAAAVDTPVLAWTGRSLDQVSGPDVTAELMAGLVQQVTSTGLPHRLWGIAPARFGPNVDLVADGSALRLHAVQDGVLVRTCEALTFQHAADGAETLLQAASAYQRLARTAEEMAAAGGLLVNSDDGFLYVAYRSTAS